MSQNFTTSPHRRANEIRPIFPISTMKIIGWKQLKALQKNRGKIRSLDINNEEMFYSDSLIKAFRRPNSSYWKSIKSVSAIRASSSSWPTVRRLFLPAPNVICRLQKFAVEVNPLQRRTKFLCRFINKMQNLRCFDDVNSNILNRDFRVVRIRSCYKVKRYNYSPNVSIKSFPRIEHLSISIPVFNVKSLRLQSCLKELSLVDQESQGKTDFGHKFYLIVKELNKCHNLTHLNLTFPFKEYYQKAFKEITNKSLTVNLVTDITSLLDSQKALTDIKTFILRTQSKVIFHPRNRSNENYSALLYLLEMHSEDYHGSFYLDTLYLNFHCPYEIQNRAYLFYSKMAGSIKKVVFSSTMDSFDWFTAWRTDNWKKFVDLVFSNPKDLEKLTVVYNIDYIDNIHIDAYGKIVKQVVSSLEQLKNGASSRQNMVNLELNVMIKHLKNVIDLADFLQKFVKAYDGRKTLQITLDGFDSDDNHRVISQALWMIRDEGVIDYFIIK